MMTLLLTNMSLHACLHGSLAMLASALAGRQVSLTCCLWTHRIDPWITDSKEGHLALLNADQESIGGVGGYKL